ncbi:hypothetical protein P9112_007507 [Eukaryota sp. TZLM1-RC]
MSDHLPPYKQPRTEDLSSPHSPQSNLTLPSSLEKGSSFPPTDESESDLDFAPHDETLSPISSSSHTPSPEHSPLLIAHQPPSSQESHPTPTDIPPYLAPYLDHSLPRGVIIDPISPNIHKVLFKPNNPARVFPKLGPLHQVTQLPSFKEPDTSLPVRTFSLPHIPYTHGVSLPTRITPLPSQIPEEEETIRKPSLFKFDYPDSEELICQPLVINQYETDLFELINTLTSVCGDDGYSPIVVLELVKEFNFNFKKLQERFINRDLKPFIYFFGDSTYGIPICACFNTKKYFNLSWSEEEKDLFTDCFLDYGRNFRKYLTRFPTKTIKELYNFFMLYWRSSSDDYTYLVEADRVRVERERRASKLRMNFLSRHQPVLYGPDKDVPASVAPFPEDQVVAERSSRENEIVEEF